MILFLFSLRCRCALSPLMACISLPVAASFPQAASMLLKIDEIVSGLKKEQGPSSSAGADPDEDA